MGTFTVRPALRGFGSSRPWKSTAFIAGLRHDAVTSPFVLDGPMNGAAFLAYIQTCLCPTVRPGDIVVADNLSCQKVAGVR